VKLSVIVLLCGVGAALLAFVISASRGIEADPVDPAAPEKAVRRSIFRHPRVARFLRARMDRKTAGGFLLTASFLVLFAVAITVGLLLDAINDHSWLANADKSVAEWGSHNGRSETIDVLKWVTQLGSTLVITAALLLTAIGDYIRRRSAEVFAFVAAIGIGELLLSNVLKQIVSRQRPAVLHLVVANGYSFPSGHTCAAAAGWSAIALVLGRDRPKVVRAALAAVAALIAVSVAASRALLGVHWLTDVIGGLAVGWGWFMIVAIIFGGRAQRLGDPVAATAAGVTANPAESAERIEDRSEHPVR
jgi:membrane-associated phospholipid phosphatase